MATDTGALLLGCKSAVITQEMANDQQQFDSSGNMRCGDLTKEFLTNKALCESLEKQGLLDLLSANDPEKLWIYMFAVQISFLSVLAASAVLRNMKVNAPVSTCLESPKQGNERTTLQ